MLKGDFETDVIVVGYGGAGATAAITAIDHDSEVLIIEKMQSGGGSTRLSGGSLLVPAGIEAMQYFEALCSGTTGLEVLESFVRKGLETKDWLRFIGGEIDESRYFDLDILYPTIPLPTWPDIAGGNSISRCHIKRSDTKRIKRSILWGDLLWELLEKNVVRRRIDIMTNTQATDLITNSKGEVVGVIAHADGKEIAIIARKAVILACGGFEYNEDMKKAFLQAHPFYALGNPGNTGDGILLSQKVGAAMWHMTKVAAPLGFKTPEYEAAFYIRVYGGRFIHVDTYGKRFVNETSLEFHSMWMSVSYCDPLSYAFPRLPAYLIFDEITRQRGPLNSYAIGFNKDYDWDLDNSKEISKGWIIKGKSIEDLAKMISVNQQNLVHTIHQYNEYCKNGRDIDFGRSKESLEPIEGPPFYAMELWPCLLNTQGGPRRDQYCRVLNYDEAPIPRLYSAGELGSLWGHRYEAGGNISECITSGRIAGENASNEKPWR